MEYFTVKSIPDFTLAKYSAEESSAVRDIASQHRTFYRQLNRRGLLFGESFSLIYYYDPSRKAGCRLSVFLRADSGNEGSPSYMDEIISASSLSPYFRFEKELSPPDAKFSCCAELSKQDGFVPSSVQNNSMEFYTVYQWKPNDKARLMGLFRLLQRINKPAVYAVTLNAADFSESMRGDFSAAIQLINSSKKCMQGTRDENAEQCLKIYEKLFESLRTAPHFICAVRAYAEDEALAKLILDSAAAESVFEGNYRINCKGGIFAPFSDSLAPSELCHENTPAGMRKWNTLFLLGEIVPFAMFPVLYAGEDIEIPKESSPVYKSDGIYLGKDKNGFDVFFPIKLLPKHAFITGVPGSGKTHAMLHISSQLAAKENNIPILVFEPAKKEYRALALNQELRSLTVFSPGTSSPFPLRINPFEFPAGIKLDEHINNLIAIFDGVFSFEQPIPMLISDGIELVYRKRGWFPSEINDGKRPYPTLSELYDTVEELIKRKGYREEVVRDFTAILRVRIGSLTARAMGDVFDVPSSTLNPCDWMNFSCVIELESLGQDAANLLTLTLLTLIRENLRLNPTETHGGTRHVIFLEEAHNIIGQSTDTSPEKADSKTASTNYIVKMLAEVRAYGEAIVIADQLPTALAPQVTKNTSMKIAMRMTAADDRQILTEVMSANGVQYERMGSFAPGHALCTYEDVLRPFEIDIHKYGGETEPPDNEALYSALESRPAYIEVMKRDFEIMTVKFDTEKKMLEERYRTVSSNGEKILERIAYLHNNNRLEESDEQYMRSSKLYSNDFKELFTDWTEYFIKLSDYLRVNRIMCKPILSRIRGDCEEIMKKIKELQYYCPYLTSETGGSIISRIKEEAASIKKYMEQKISRDLRYKAHTDDCTE